MRFKIDFGKDASFTGNAACLVCRSASPLPLINNNGFDRESR